MKPRPSKKPARGAPYFRAAAATGRRRGSGCDRAPGSKTHTESATGASRSGLVFTGKSTLGQAEEK